MTCAAAALSGCSVPANTTSSTASDGAGNVTGSTAGAAGGGGRSGGAWTYTESKDEMRGTSRKVATVESNESYANTFGMGEEHTTLGVQKGTKSVDIFFSNPNLQYTCNSFTGTRIHAKFDSGPVQSYSCTSAQGDKFGVAYLASGSGFYAKLRKARKLIVETDVFQRGGVQQSFDVAGLEFK